MDSQENSASVEVAPQSEQSTDNNVSLEMSKKAEEARQERNWREMRQKQQELEQEIRLQREMNERLLKMTSQNAPQVVDEIDQLADDETLDKGKSKKLVKKEIDPLLKQIEELKSEIKIQKQNQHLNDLRKEFPDFDEVVNAETCDLLEQFNPKLAAAIAKNKDPYEFSLMLYENIKAKGIQEKVPSNRRAKEIEKKIEKNDKTIQTPQAFDKRPLAQAFKITDAEKKAIYKEMMEYAGQAGFSY